MSEASFHLSFYGLCTVLLWLAGRGILGGRTIFAFPTLAAMMGLAWVVPQGIELEANSANPYGSNAFWLYVTACFLCIAFGFRVGYSAHRRRIAREPNHAIPHFDNKRLLLAAAGLTALGLLAEFQMRGIDTSAMGRQWTGVITMWALLAKAGGFGLCLAVLVFARTRSWLALAISALAVAPLAQAAFLGVRREALFDLVILTAGSWYIVRRSYPPRLLAIATLLLGTVVLNSVEDIRIRVLSEGESFAEVMLSKETYQSFDYTSLDQGERSEVGQAQYDIWYANETWRWELGAAHWNNLIHQYVPAFLLGREFKDSLRLSTVTQRIGSGEEAGLNSIGSTRTGFSDSYRAFGIFGCLIFAAVAYYFGFLYAKSILSSIDSQYLYLVLLAEGLKAITHSTGSFLTALPFTLILYWFVFRISKMRKIAIALPHAHQSNFEVRDLKKRV